MPRGDSIGIAAIPSTLAGAPLTWWSGRERQTSESGTSGRNDNFPAKNDGWSLTQDADPVVFGVHKTKQKENKGAIPPYIGRDIDADVYKCISQAAQKGGFVLLAGDSTSGKTRTAFYAMTTLLSGYRVVNPPIGVNFRQLVNDLPENSDKYALWLDDLEGYIGVQGLQADIIDDLIKRNVVLISTIRHEQLEHFRRNRIDKDRNHVGPQDAYVGSQVINLANIIEVPRKWSDDEVGRASHSDDPRIQEALEQSHLYGVAEYVAAGPQLLEEWKQAFRANGSPRGAALVSAAIDFTRVGLVDAVPVSLIKEVHHTYLSKEGGELLHPESLEEAIQWATAVRFGVTSMLQPVSDGNWRPFDYLVDATARHSVDPPPEEVWQAALGQVDSPRGFYAIGINALFHGRVDITETAWSTAATNGDASVSLELGTLFWQRKRIEDAEYWYSKSYDLGNRRSALRLGDMLAANNRLADAQPWWEAAANHGVPEARIRQIIDADYLDHALTKVISDSPTKDSLGDLGISETLLNLWPVDCQTCGRPLGEETPSLCFSDIPFKRLASLHHAVCRGPAWDADNLTSSDALISWKSISFVTGITSRAGETFNRMPIVMINPTLESVWISYICGEWRASRCSRSATARWGSGPRCGRCSPPPPSRGVGYTKRRT